jgi:hypothetical protein
MPGAQTNLIALTDFGQKRATGITRRAISVQALTEFPKRFLQFEWNRSQRIGAQTRLPKSVGDFATLKRAMTALVELGLSLNVAIITKF